MLLKSPIILDNETNPATVSSIMADDKKRRTHPQSQLLAGYGAVTPKQKSEDWRKIRVDMEAAVAAEAAGEDSYPVYLLLGSLAVIRKMLANRQQKGVKRH
jgi:hypothetical protein